MVSESNKKHSNLANSYKAWYYTNHIFFQVLNGLVFYNLLILSVANKNLSSPFVGGLQRPAHIQRRSSSPASEYCKYWATRNHLGFAEAAGEVHQLHVREALPLLNVSHTHGLRWRSYRLVSVLGKITPLDKFEGRFVEDNWRKGSSLPGPGPWPARGPRRSAPFLEIVVLVGELNWAGSYLQSEYTEIV